MDSHRLAPPPVTGPGVYRGISRADYDAIDALNQSTLKEFAKNPEAFMDGLPRRDGSSFVWGNLFETLLLEPEDAWRDQFAVLDDETKAEILAQANSRQTRKSGKFNKNLSEYRGWLDEANKSGKTVIDIAEFRACQLAVSRARREPNIAGLLSLGGESQVGIVWEDPSTKLLCKGLIDWVPEGISSLVDVKTTKEVMDCNAGQAAWRFARAVRKLGYDLQASWYLEGWYLAHEQSGAGSDPRNGWLFVVSGNGKPWPAAAWRMPDSMIHEGSEKAHAALNLWAECHETGHFPGITTEERWPMLPVID